MENGLESYIWIIYPKHRISYSLPIIGYNKISLNTTCTLDY